MPLAYDQSAGEMTGPTFVEIPDYFGATSLRELSIQPSTTLVNIEMLNPNGKGYFHTERTVRGSNWLATEGI